MERVEAVESTAVLLLGGLPFRALPLQLVLMLRTLAVLRRLPLPPRVGQGIPHPRVGTELGGTLALLRSLAQPVDLRLAAGELLPALIRFELGLLTCELRRAYAARRLRLCLRLPLLEVRKPRLGRARGLGGLVGRGLLDRPTCLLLIS